MKKIIFAIALLFILCFTLTACTTSLADINKNPENYVGKQITVSGTVKDTFKLGTLSGYTLIDDDGNSIKISSKALPAEGSQKTVSGTFVKQSIIIATSYYLQTDE